MDEIVAKAGLSKGTFYWHFESKEELFAALLEERVDRPAQALMEVTRSAPAEGATAPEVSHGLATLFRSSEGSSSCSMSTGPLPSATSGSGPAISSARARCVMPLPAPSPRATPAPACRS